MSLFFLANVSTFADIDEMKTASPEGSGKLKRVDKDVRIVRDIGNGYSPRAYQFNQNLTLSEELPAIVAPLDNIGVWVMLDQPFVLASANPANPPQLLDYRYIANLSSPNRTIIYEARSLSDPAVVSDWQPVDNIIKLDAAPTFEPDYQQQMVWDTATNTLFLADGTAADASSWLPTTWLYGGNLTGAKTVNKSDRRRWFTVSANMTLTLPGDLDREVEMRFIIDTASVTLTLDPEVATSASLVGSASVTDSCLLRNNGSVWYRV